MLAVSQGEKGRKDARLAVAGLVAAMTAAAVLLLLEGWGLTLLIDEWSFGYGSRTNLDLAAFVDPHNGHLVVVQVFITKGALQVFGSDAALPLLLTSVGIHLGVAACLFALLRDPLGPLAALAPAVLVLFLGVANDAIVGSHGMSNTIAVLCGLSAWLALHRRKLAWDIAAASLLTLAVCSNASGIPFSFGAFALIALDRDSTWRRLSMAIVPLAVYGAWWLIEGRGDGQFAIANLGGLPSFTFDSLAAALGAISGLFTTPGSRSGEFDLSAGQALAGASLISILVLVLGWRYRPSRATIPVLVALLSFWLLTAGVAGPARQPEASRFLYVGVVLLLLLLAQMIAASPVRLDGALALAAICAFALLPNIRELTYGADFFQEQSERNRAVMGAADLLDGQAPSTLMEIPQDWAEGNVPDLQFSLEQYVASARRFGSPALSLKEMEHASPGARVDADRFIVRALSPRVQPATGPPGRLPVRHVSQSGGVLVRRGRCLRFEPRTFGAQVSVGLPESGLWLDSAPGPFVPIGLRRFASDFRTVIGPALSGRPSTFRFPPGPASSDWQAQLKPEQPILLCAA
jgi:hypothetical protein